MKYKDFKTLSQSEMKGIKGGNAPLDDGGGITCKTSCTAWNAVTGRMDSGTCSKSTSTVGGTTVENCNCSLSGASSCYNN